MVSYKNEGNGLLYPLPEGDDGAGKQEFWGKSTDTKPTAAPNAAAFYEIDTKATYLFDADSRTWLAQ